MGTILGYVVLLSNLSLILAAQQYLIPPQATTHDREKQNNFTHVASGDQNVFLNKNLLPPDPPPRRRSPPPKHMLSSVGLHAFASDNLEWNLRRRNSSDRNPTFSDLPKRNLLPTFPRTYHPRKNPKTSHHLDSPSQNLYRLNNQTTKRTDAPNRRYHEPRRTPRYHPTHSPKICDPCNSVPWIPLLKVPDSYRQQRTHITELHPTPQQNFNFDHHAYASDTHNILLPPLPLAPPLFDGTISSSFGLPIGNIPTSHGLLAPINHLAIDYTNSFNYYSPHGLLENDNFPQLSPVPVVPIHDSAQFYHFDSSVPDLVPPPVKDVSNVVLTISEDQTPTNTFPPNHKNPDPAPTSDSKPIAPHLRTKQQHHPKDFTRLEIVKSIPLAEFTSSLQSPHQQQLPLYPPLHSDFSHHQPHTKKSNSTHSAPNFLVPPPKTLPITSNNTTDPVAQATAPKPLTSSSLSWLFYDHTAPPPESKNAASAPPFPATDAQEIASVVNDHLRPVSSPPDQNVGATKSKKIQIIIPYTTKAKNGHDNSASESVQHEVFRPPVFGQSTNVATSALPPSSEVTDRPPERRYLSEMHHIIATNIRELLRGEIDQSQKDQNYRLQNNIDNWTALEFSNHKTVGTKAPKEVIAQALSVTSIPGTSISHLLLPSKKIPNEYFGTTPIPVYDEPNTSAYRAENSSVNSRPFTAKPYATTNVYNPTKSPNERAKQQSGGQVNHERNYTEVGRGRVNIWGKLNENLVLPEARSGSEKVQVVTAVPASPEVSFRRTTRHAHATESPTAGKLSRKSLFPHRLNSTRLEKVSNLTSSLDSASVRSASSSRGVSGAETTNSTVGSVAVGQEKGKGEQFSINDIFPFRNKELPWESSRNSSEPAGRTVRQRQSLIKQVNLQRSKVVADSL